MMNLIIYRNVAQLNGEIKTIEEVIPIEYYELIHLEDYITVRYSEVNKLYQIFFKDYYLVSSKNDNGLITTFDLNNTISLIRKVWDNTNGGRSRTIIPFIEFKECEVRTMEGLEKYKESYESIRNMKKLCCCDEVTINFTQFDEVTASKLRNVISETLNVREKEIQKVIFRAE